MNSYEWTDLCPHLNEITISKHINYPNEARDIYLIQLKTEEMSR
jgi:hypothetical protein